MLKDLSIAAYKQWKDDNISQLSAGLAYYTVFSLAPLLIICIALAGLIFNHDYVANTVLAKMSEAFGTGTASQVNDMMTSIAKPSSNTWTTIVGIVVLIWGVAGYFRELQYCFNTIWHVQVKPGRKWYAIIRDRFLSFTVVLGVSFLLLVSLLFSSFVSALTNHMHHIMPTTTYLWVVVDFSLSTLAITFLFSIIFKVLPDVILKWRDVALGAFITSLLFSLGKFLITIYLAKSQIATYYGAAASFVILLIWVYYSIQILLFGAAFTRAYALEYGSQFQAKHMAKHIGRRPLQSL